MSEGNDTWQWVDEDPISAILSSVRPAKRTGPPDDVPAHALALQAGDITKEAVAQLEQFTEAGAAADAAAGGAQLDPGRFGETAGSYRRAFEANPDATGHYNHAAGHYNRAVAMALLEQWEAAADEFEGALALEPRSSEARLGRAVCDLQLGHAGPALDAFEALGEVQAALFGRAVALQLLERYEEAESAYLKWLEAVPNSIEALQNLIALSFVAKPTEVMSKYAHRLLDLDPKSIPALQALTIEAFETGDYDAAVSYSGRLTEVNPNNFGGPYLRATGQVLVQHAIRLRKGAMRANRSTNEEPERDELPTRSVGAAGRF